MCEHQWQKIHEEFLLGGYNAIGYQCKLCNKFVSQSEIGLAGLPGIDTKENILVGPHRLRSHTSTGKEYSKQILYPDGRLEIIK